MDIQSAVNILSSTIPIPEISGVSNLLKISEVNEKFEECTNLHSPGTCVLAGMADVVASTAVTLAGEALISAGAIEMVATAPSVVAPTLGLAGILGGVELVRRSTEVGDLASKLVIDVVSSTFNEKEILDQITDTLVENIPEGFILSPDEYLILKTGDREIIYSPEETNQINECIQLKYYSAQQTKKFDHSITQIKERSKDITSALEEVKNLSKIYEEKKQEIKTSISFENLDSFVGSFNEEYFTKSYIKNYEIPSLPKVEKIPWSGKIQGDGKVGSFIILINLISIPLGGGGGGGCVIL